VRLTVFLPSEAAGEELTTSFSTAGVTEETQSHAGQR